MGNKWIRPVSFNKTKEQDQKRLKHIGRKGFGGYVKKLIDEDMVRNPKKEKSQPQPEGEKKEELSASEKMAQMRDQLKPKN